MTQTTLDLRAALAALATEPEAVAPASRRPAISQGRRDLVLTMMQERYPAEVVAERFPKIDWDNMTVADFNRRFEALKAVPRLGQDWRSVKRAEEIASVGRQDLVDGYYTIVFEDEVEEEIDGEMVKSTVRSHLTLRLRTQKGDAEFMPGRMIVSLLVGPNNEADYMRVGHVLSGGVKVWSKHRNNAKLDEALLVLCGDPRAAQAAYAEASRCCAKCGRTLTHPDSQVFGPDCAKAMGA